jgi:hypothetical protein
VCRNRHFDHLNSFSIQSIFQRHVNIPVRRRSKFGFLFFLSAHDSRFIVDGPPTILFVALNREDVDEHVVGQYLDPFLARLRRKRALLPVS